MVATTNSADERSAFLSERGRASLKSLPAYISKFFSANSQAWSPDNPEGDILLAVAENKLSCDLLEVKMKEAATDWPTSAFSYGPMKGVERLRKAIAAMLEATFMKGASVDPAQMAVSSGAGAILDQLFFSIANPGESVLIPAPYYPAFDNDLQVRNEVVPVPVHLWDLETAVGAGGGSGVLGAEGIEQRLDAALEKEQAAGRKLRAVLLCNPNNPLGTVNSVDATKTILMWCLRHRVHIISDEIYGNSVYNPEKAFVSLYTLMQQLGGPEKVAEAAGCTAEAVQQLVHIVAGLSKDWCASGFRVGCLLTASTSVHAVLDNIAYFAAVSQPAQHMIASVLEDRAFVQSYVAQNTERMAFAYDQLTAALHEAAIPYTAACAAMFLWVDLRHVLKQPTWEEEQALWQHICDNHHVIMTPGEACRAVEPGFFRICFCWVPTEALLLAVQRVREGIAVYTA